MTTQEKIILATEETSKAYLTFINSVELNREFQTICNAIMATQGTYTTAKTIAASGTALVNMILNNKI